MSSGWHRISEHRYALIYRGARLMEIEKCPYPAAGPFSLWQIVGRLGQFPTLRDAKQFAEAQFVKGDWEAPWRQRGASR